MASLNVARMMKLLAYVLVLNSCLRTHSRLRSIKLSALSDEGEAAIFKEDALGVLIAVISFPVEELLFHLTDAEDVSVVLMLPVKYVASLTILL
jgi:hypothetical protein